MTKHSQVEIERKYDVDEKAVPPRLVGAGAVALESDSGDRRTRRGLLRHPGPRLSPTTGSPCACGTEAATPAGTVKLPGDEGRTELSWPLGDAEGAESGSELPPAEVVDAVREYIGDAPLEPLARVTNTRTTVILQDAAGFAIAELCDDHVRSESLRAPQADHPCGGGANGRSSCSRAHRTPASGAPRCSTSIEARVLEAGRARVRQLVEAGARARSGLARRIDLRSAVLAVQPVLGQDRHRGVNEVRSTMKIGILTSGGDCPGLNAVIRGAVLKGDRVHDAEFAGFRYGWRGVVDGDIMPLDRHSVRGLSRQGGTILGSSRTNPFEGENGGPENIQRVMDENGIDAIIAIGGEGTLTAARRLTDAGHQDRRRAEDDRQRPRRHRLLVRLRHRRRDRDRGDRPPAHDRPNRTSAAWSSRSWAATSAGSPCTPAWPAVRTPS